MRGFPDRPGRDIDYEGDRFQGMSEMTRRQSLWAIPAFFAVFSGVFQAVDQMLNSFDSQKTEAEFLFDSFPRIIPSARVESIYPVSGANRLMVHLKQRHWDDGAVVDPQKLDEIILCQDSIYKILMYLIENYGLSEVYCEHLYQDEFLPNPECFLNKPASVQAVRLFKTSDFRQSMRHFSHRLKKVVEDGEYSAFYNGYSHRHVRDAYWSAYPWLVDVTFEDFFVRQAAAASLYLQGELNLRPAELTRKINGEREPQLLQILSDNREKFGLVIYGGKHEFVEFIKVWNRQFPSDKVCLIEVTPDDYNCGLEED